MVEETTMLDLLSFEQGESSKTDPFANSEHLATVNYVR
jgi:hypothetical protein